MRRLILRSFQSPGDILMLTAAVRDLHAAHPSVFQTDVRTSASPLWEHNPHLTPLHEGQAGVEVIDMYYPLIHQSNQRPYHFLHGYAQYLEQALGVRVPVTRFHGDVHLSADEKTSPPCQSLGLPERFWIVVAGGKFDFTAKWWDPAGFQAVADHFQGKIRFVQCGEQGHWHPRLRGTVDLVGKTNLREFVRLMHHADGVLCPVTFAMHLAAAVETRPGRPKNRACVVVAGGREPPQWEAYPHHQYISTNEQEKVSRKRFRDRFHKYMLARNLCINKQNKPFFLALRYYQPVSSRTWDVPCGSLKLVTSTTSSTVATLGVPFSTSPATTTPLNASLPRPSRKCQCASWPTA